MTMNDEKIKIVSKDGRIITLKELFEGKERARQEMAKLPLEDKVRALVSLQELAYNWGNRKDIVVWRL